MLSDNASDPKSRFREGAEITIRDIARELKISHTTVSRALADSPKISEKTKLRVRMAVEQMGYVPSASARTMRGMPSSLVGLVIPDVQNDFYATVAKVLADALAARSMHLLLSVTDDNGDRELSELRTILETRPAGIIIVPSASPRPETEALLRNIETVQLIRVHPKFTCNAVLIDDHEGTLAATRHLLSYGHKRLGYIGGDELRSTGRDRLAGFQDALAEYSLTPAAVWLGSPRPEFARHAVTSMMSTKNRPTGLILGSAELTLGALQALRAMRLNWPRDVSVVGYHDPAWFELAEGGITTVRLPVEEIATSAASLLLSHAQSHNADTSAPSTPTEVRFAPSLVLRGSTGPWIE